MIFAAIKWGRWNYFTCVRTLFLLAARIIIRKAAFYWRLLCWQLHSSRYLFARGRRKEERKLLNVRADNFRHLNAHIQPNIFRAIEFFLGSQTNNMSHIFVILIEQAGLYKEPLEGVANYLYAYDITFLTYLSVFISENKLACNVK